MGEVVVGGIDVHASDRKSLFVAVVHLCDCGSLRLQRVERLKGIAQVVGLMLESKAVAVGIDAPQPLSAMRVGSYETLTAESSLASGGMRACERELIRKYGIRCFPTTPTTFASFKKLILAGWQLYFSLMQSGFKIAVKGKRRKRSLIEVYPHATFALLSREKLASKNTQFGRMQRFAILEQHIGGLDRFFGDRLPNADELDAIASALTACLWWRGRCEALGGYDGKGYLFVPKR
jgi:predicted nuclease with RNAse H fold